MARVKTTARRSKYGNVLPKKTKKDRLATIVARRQDKEQQVECSPSTVSTIEQKPKSDLATGSTTNHEYLAQQIVELFQHVPKHVVAHAQMVHRLQTLFQDASHTREFAYIPQWAKEFIEGECTYRLPIRTRECRKPVILESYNSAMHTFGLYGHFVFDDYTKSRFIDQDWMPVQLVQEAFKDYNFNVKKDNDDWIMILSGPKVDNQ